MDWEEEDVELSCATALPDVGEQPSIPTRPALEIWRDTGDGSGFRHPFAREKASAPNHTEAATTENKKERNPVFAYLLG